MIKLERYLFETLGYQDYEAELTIKDIKGMDEESQTMLEKLIDGEDVRDYSVGNYSVGKLIDEKGFNEVAAIISISNLKKDYERYDALYKRPIK